MNLTRDSSPPLEARAFLSSGDRTIHLRSAKPSVCMQLEPVGATFTLEDLDPASLRLGRADSDQEPIQPVPSKRPALSDTDRNGIAEIGVCFAKEAVRGLFADVRGPANVAVLLSGSLTEGRRIEAGLNVRVVPGPGGRPPLAARIAPNPMNPVSTLTFVTDRAGPVRVTIFDVHGRTVTTLLDSKLVEPGEHQIRLGAGARPGSELASGIYFYRVETRDDRVTGRFAVLK